MEDNEPAERNNELGFRVCFCSVEEATGLLGQMEDV